MRTPGELLRKILRTHMPLLFFISLALVFLFFGRAEYVIVEKIKQISMDAFAPVLIAASRPVATVSQLGTDLGHYFDVFEDNRQLREETAQLKVWREKALSLEARIARYEALLNVQPEPEITYLTGRIIGDSDSPFVHTILVNAGQNQGVKNGQAVIDGFGLAGRVVSAGRWASRVLLLTDLNSRVPVMVEPGNYHAILAGDNTGTPRLEHLPSDEGITPGDRIVTSGYGGFLSPGLPVGVVLNVEENGPRVQLFADSEGMDVVRILKYDANFDVAEPEATPVVDADQDGGQTLVTDPPGGPSR